MKKLTKNDFEAKSRVAHGSTYDYSNSDYKSCREKVSIKCKTHGEFFQYPMDHVRGSGCPRCGGTGKLTLEDFITKAKLIHGDKYDYSLTEYHNHATKTQISCGNHGEFYQTPNDHLSGTGCPRCGGTGKLNLNDFILKARSVHKDKYDYSKSSYIDSHTKLIIVCKKHGEFLQKPNSHLNGHGCSKCCESKGERKIREVLIDLGLAFESQYRNESCKNKHRLPFDFAVFKDEQIFLIEYNGEQHYRPVGFGGNKELLYKKLCKNDAIKKEWCKNQGVKLLCIPYTEFNSIRNIIEDWFIPRRFV